MTSALSNKKRAVLARFFKSTKGNFINECHRLFQLPCQ
ncbi:hypothetical protein PALB_29940 [Pseudoalteromonas luteoviolacea B = ATCC 29581]|nr:hypothetical protein PALB_29940 [Pseudoalteromonas luteoviolacea B = ATCC 29581]